MASDTLHRRGVPNGSPPLRSIGASMPVSETSLASSSAESSTELDFIREAAALRSQNTALTRELGVLRWQFSKLLEQQPAVRAGAIQAAHSFRRRFPRLAGRVAQAKRIWAERRRSR